MGEATGLMFYLSCLFEEVSASIDWGLKWQLKGNPSLLVAFPLAILVSLISFPYPAAIPKT